MTERLERFGLAGFGWGASWLDADGGLRSHRHAGIVTRCALGVAAASAPRPGAARLAARPPA